MQAHHRAKECWNGVSFRAAAAQLAYCIVFALLLNLSMAMLTPMCALPLAYGASRSLAAQTPVCHGPFCRLCTVGAVSSVVAVVLGPGWSAAVTLVLLICPRWALLFPPKAADAQQLIDDVRQFVRDNPGLYPTESKNHPGRGLAKRLRVARGKQAFDEQQAGWLYMLTYRRQCDAVVRDTDFSWSYSRKQPLLLM